MRKVSVPRLLLLRLIDEARKYPDCNPEWHEWQLTLDSPDGSRIAFECLDSAMLQVISLSSSHVKFMQQHMLMWMLDGYSVRRSA